MTYSHKYNIKNENVMDIKTYDSMVVFDKPTKIADYDYLVYGCVFSAGDCSVEAKIELEADIHSYIKYLSSLTKWYADGGTIEDKNRWIDADGVTHFFYKYDEFFMEYMERAYQEHPIRYTIKFNVDIPSEECLDDNSMIKRLEVEV